MDAAQAPDLTEAQNNLPAFNLKFIRQGIRCEFERYLNMVTPSVNRRGYHVVFACECVDLEVHYIPGDRGNWFYGVCAAHGLQPLGRAIRTARGVDGRSEERRRKSGVTTEHWHRSRGL